jgi:hypothetical protein
MVKNNKIKYSSEISINEDEFTHLEVLPSIGICIPAN